MRRFGFPEAPGVSVFYRDAEGDAYHTYSCYARGLDALNGAYQWLDLVPKGRDEAELPYTMVGPTSRPVRSLELEDTRTERDGGLCESTAWR
jgi:hypothetical protein